MPDQSTRDPRTDFNPLRQSLMADFDLCGLMTYFELEYRRGWSGHPQARGQLFHRFAARALHELHRSGESHMEPDVGHAILNEVLRQQDVPDEDFVVIPMKEIKDLHWVVTKWCHDNTWDIQNLVDVEQRLSANLLYPDATERTLSGQLDALFVQGEESDHAIVVDWKDTWALPAPSELDESGYFQQRFYAWLVMRNYPSLQRVTLREFYVRYSEPREATVWRDDLDDIQGQLAALAERFDRAYRENLWPPSPGKHCQHCPRPSACPIPDFAKGEGAVRSREVAEKMAARLIVAESAAKQARKALKGYAEAHGAIPVKAAKGRAVWGFRASERVNRPERDELAAALARAGVDGINLDLLYKKVTSTRFDQHAPTEADEPSGDDAILGQLEASLEQAKRERAK